MQSQISRTHPVGFCPAVTPKTDNFCLEVAARHWASSLELPAMGKRCPSFPLPTALGPGCPRTALEHRQVQVTRRRWAPFSHGDSCLWARISIKTDGTGGPLPAARKINLFLGSGQNSVLLGVTLSKGAWDCVDFEKHRWKTPKLCFLN